VRPGAPFSREKIVEFLENKGVETRPISAGNIAEQPVMKFMNARKIGELPNAQIVMRNSFEWGNHQGIGEEERSYVVEIIKEFVHGHSSLGA
jgi:CDP-6-deoxy-D-xylo-4-hexulose-3-dehydrase